MYLEGQNKKERNQCCEYEFSEKVDKNQEVLKH